MRPYSILLAVGVLAGGFLTMRSLMGRMMKPPEQSAAPVQTLTPDRPVRGDIEVWSWNIAAKSLKALVPAFSERYPDVAVRVNMTGADMQTRFFLSLCAGVGGPDISQIGQREALRYAATGQLADLTPAASRYRDAFPPSLWETCSFDGRIYGIPWDMGPCAVFYKRELFARYGVDAGRIETWDDFIEAGRVILDKSGGRTRMMALSTGELQGTFRLLMQQNGSQLFDEQGRIAVNSPESYQALRILKKLIESGVTHNMAPSGREFLAGLKNDAIATYPGAVWFGGTIKDTVQEYPGQASQWGVFRLPAIEPGGLRNSSLGGSVLVIPAQCDQKEAAWAFIEYALCTVEGQIAQYRNYDLFPAYLPAHDHPFLSEPDPFYGNQPARKLFALDLTRIPPLYSSSDWFQAERYLREALGRWAISGMPVEGFFDELEKSLSRRIGRPVAPRALSLVP